MEQAEGHVLHRVMHVPALGWKYPLSVKKREQDLGLSTLRKSRTNPLLCFHLMVLFYDERLEFERGLYDGGYSCILHL